MRSAIAGAVTRKLHRITMCVNVPSSSYVSRSAPDIFLTLTYFSLYKKKESSVLKGGVDTFEVETLIFLLKSM